MENGAERLTRVYTRMMYVHVCGMMSAEQMLIVCVRMCGGSETVAQNGWGARLLISFNIKVTLELHAVRMEIIFCCAPMLPGFASVSRSRAGATAVCSECGCSTLYARGQSATKSSPRKSSMIYVGSCKRAEGEKRRINALQS